MGVDHTGTPFDRAPFTQAIQRLSRQDWHELADLTRRLAAYDGPFYEISGGQRDTPGVITMPYYVSAPMVDELSAMLYAKELIVPFARSDWEDGRAIASSELPDRYDTVTPEEALMLLTYIVRNSRFSEGAFDLWVEQGDAVMVLNRLLVARPSDTTEQLSTT